MTVIRPIRLNMPVAEDAEIIVVGSGMAGMVTALRLAPRKVTLLTKTPSLTGGSTAWAQGGIAAAVGADDTPQAHAADTMVAGAGLNEASVVELLTRDGAARLRELIDTGAPFDRDGAGKIVLGREAAHGQRRIVHAGGDATGRHVHRWLADAVAETPSIDVQTAAFAWELVVRDGRVCGVVAYHERDGWILHRAPFVVLATGGSGQLYQCTTNPPESTADGLAMAARAGATLADLEFVQFHPTALADRHAPGGMPMPLLTEALRGEGATLVDGSGRRFMLDEHADGDLAPRDVVARAIWQRLVDGKGAFLDMRALMSGALAHRFPTVLALCHDAGFDPAREVIPVAPAAHYHMGGIAADDHGRTSLQGLWACGEAAATGVHGANRLASNSLLEGLVFGHRVADDIAGRPLPPRSAPQSSAPAVPGSDAAEAITSLTGHLRAFMYEKVGLRRDGAGLHLALSAHRELADRIGEIESRSGPSTPSLDDVRRWGELRNLALAGRLVTLAASRRGESRGAHFRTDFPQPAAAAGVRHYLTLEDLDDPADVQEGRRDDTSNRTAAALSA
ncbi:MAG: L-aspartate oxidase [Proteobacteria bacterium]|nr:L-aspartate oxidase [Pseudomonadota bacterium]